MKRLIQLILTLVAAAALSSCGFGSNAADVHEVANKTTIEYSGSTPLEPDPEANEVLHEAFLRDMGIPWIEGEDKRARRYLESISAKFSYLQTRRAVDGSLPYYIYRAGFEEIRYNYLQLEPILDRRAKQGVLGKAERVVYNTTKRDIKLKLELELYRIQRTEESINAETSANAIESLKRTYEILRPIIDLAI